MYSIGWIYRKCMTITRTTEVLLKRKQRNSMWSLAQAEGSRIGAITHSNSHSILSCKAGNYPSKLAQNSRLSRTYLRPCGAVVGGYFNVNCIYIHIRPRDVNRLPFVPYICTNGLRNGNGRRLIDVHICTVKWPSEIFLLCQRMDCKYLVTNIVCI